MEQLLTYIVVALGWMCGGIVGGATGIGGVMIAMPLLTLVLDPGDAILVSCLVAATACVHLAWAYRRFIVWPDVWPLLAGMVPGLIAGVAMLKIAPVPVLELMICAMLVCFLLMQCSPRLARFSVPASLPLGLGAGAVSGFVASSVAMSGAPLGIYVLLMHWEPDRARGNMSIFYLCSGISAMLMQAFSGLYSYSLLKLGVAALAGCMAGQTLGVSLGRHISRETFRRILLIFLAAAAVVLFVRAVS
ncbi:sulfite exporter TauE/SafE family protein [uncultured Mailhella sp.]|uniref:sulfite exporter TauE/SafE family protein n=1 Tax=uncultured Mailhella sp. TaxID=1981031 RepID=UPI00262722CE|nr:sulfite exporter TauE/SafE family protein [uncultured Mailhella sp.]